MATTHLKSTSITGLDTVPIQRANPWMHGGGVKAYAATVEALDADSTSSTYRMFRIGSWMRAHQLLLSCDALSAGAVNIGLWRTTVDGGAVVDADFFASAQSVASALNQTNVTYEANDAATNMGINEAEKRIWEVLGLTTDPNLEYDVVIQPSTALGAAGTITLTALMTY